MTRLLPTLTTQGRDIEHLGRQVKALKRIAGVTAEQEAEALAEQERLDEAERDERDQRRWKQRQAAGSPEMEAVNREIARQQQARDNWLAMCGVPADAGDELKLMIVSLGDAFAQPFFADLVNALAGKVSDGSPPLQQIISSWPSLSPAVQSSLARVAEQYGIKCRDAARRMDTTTI